MIQPLSSADDGPQRASALSETRATDSRADASSDDDTGRSYDAFISYSHKGERDLARSLERTLRTFGRKWYQTHGIRTFRDETNLAAEPDLWPGIRRAVRHSRNLVLLASPDAARSEWVPREVEAAVQARGISSLCIVQSAGLLRWTDPKATPEMLAGPERALPSQVDVLFAKAKVEPVVVDLRSFRELSESERATNAEYLSAIATVAAKILGTDKESIWGEFHRAQRLRNIFLASVAIVLIALLAALGVLLSAERDARHAAELALAEAYFREAVTRRDSDKPSESLAYATRAVQLNPNNAAASTLALDLLLWQPWPKFAVDVKQEYAPVAISDDGRALLVGEGNHASFYETSSQKSQPATLTHDVSVKAVGLTADGSRAVTGDSRGKVRVWSTTEARAILPEALTWGKSINGLAVSPDGKYVAAASDAGVRVWELSTGTVRTSFTEAGTMGSVAFSRDGKRIVSLGSDFNMTHAHVFDVASGARVGKPFSTEGDFPYACLDEHGERVLIAHYGAPSSARIWHVATSKAASPPLVHNDYVVGARFLDDGYMLTISSDGTGRIWDPKKVGSSPPRAAFVHEATLSTAATSADGWWVVTASSGGAIRMWNRRTGLRLPLKVNGDGPDRDVQGGNLSPDGQYAVSITRQAAKVVSMSTGVTRVFSLDPQGVHGAISADGNRLAVLGSSDSGRFVNRDSVTMLDTTTGRKIFAVQARRQGQTMEGGMPTFGLDYSAAANRVVFSHGRFADLVDATTGQLIGSELSHDDVIRTSRFSANGDRLVTTSRDGTARIWNSADGTPVGPPLQHPDPVVAASFVSGSDEVMTASRRGVLRTWALSTRTSRSLPLRGVSLIGSAAFSGDGKRAVTTDFSSGARVWDTASGLPLAEPLGQAEAVIHLKLSEDGTRLLTVGNSILVWDMPSGSPAEAGTLVEWGESVAGVRVSESGTLTPVHDAAERLARLRASAESSPRPEGAIWASLRWFFADPSKRTFSPRT